MNSSNSTTVTLFTRVLAFVLASVLHVSVKAAWELDLSRRSKDISKNTGPSRLKLSEPAKKTWVQDVAGSVEPIQDVVLIHTQAGFIPDTVRMKKGQPYRLHIVNVNEQEKNVSFIMDAFSEHHATYFGQEKSFVVTPQQEGVFSFLCPETAKQGTVVVVPVTPSRQTASTPQD